MAAKRDKTKDIKNQKDIKATATTKRKQTQEKVAYLASFPELNPMFVIEIDSSGKLYYLNPATKQSFPDLAVRGFEHPFLASLKSGLKSLQQTENTSTTFEVRVGQQYYEQIALKLGENGHIRIYSHDITERKRAEEKQKRLMIQVQELSSSLAQEKDTLQTIMENTAAMLAYFDTEFNFVRINSPYAIGSGRAAEELIGKNHFDLFPNAENEAIFQQVRDTGKPIAFHDKPFEFADQPERGITYWDWTLNPVKDAAGKVQGLVLSLIETTERVLAEKEVQKALERTRQRQMEITSLLDGSHAILKYREFPDAARAVFTICKNLISAKAGYIALLSKDKTENEVVFLDPGGLPCTVDPSLPMPIRGLRAEAFQSGKAVYDNHFQDSVWVKYMPPGHVELESVLFAPLVIEGETVGLLGLASKPGGFDQHDADVATAFGELAAIALKNSRMLEALESSEARFHTVFEKSPYGILISDAETMMPIEFNNGLASQLGYSREEFAKLSISDFEVVETAEAIRARTQRMLSQRGDFFETKHRTKSGEIRAVEVTAKVIELAGKPIVLAIFNDITERKQAEERLLAYERLATLGKVAGNISHELRNPLATIDSSVFYLQTKLKEADEKVIAHLDRIHASVLRSTGIIQSLLDLTRMQEPRRQEVDLRIVASETIALSKVPSTVKIVQDFPEQEVWVNADRNQLHMAFGNIIDNAVQAMDGDGTLTLVIRRTTDHTEISFADTGPGISTENLGKLFQPLFSTKARGIGFGLSIAKMIIERHGGTIAAKSEVGKGAIFIIRLPLYTNQAGKGGDVKSTGG